MKLLTAQLLSAGPGRLQLGAQAPDLLLRPGLQLLVRRAEVLQLQREGDGRCGTPDSTAPTRSLQPKPRPEVRGPGRGHPPAVRPVAVSSVLLRQPSWEAGLSDVNSSHTEQVPPACQPCTIGAALPGRAKGRHAGQGQCHLCSQGTGQKGPSCPLSPGMREGRWGCRGPGCVAQAGLCLWQRRKEQRLSREA